MARDTCARDDLRAGLINGTDIDAILADLPA